MSLFIRLRSGTLLLLAAILVIVSLTPPGARLHAAPPNQAPSTPGTTVTVDDVIQSIKGSTWIVGDRTIQVTGQTVVSGTPVVGKKAHLIAVMDDNGQLIAQTIVIVIIIQAPTLAPTLTATPTITQPPTVTLTPSITPGGPTLTPSLTPIATSTPIPYVTIVIEGPVEVIDLNIDIVVVYGQRVKLRHNDPLRTKLQVGDWIRANGNYSVDVDQQIVITVVTIVIINAPTTIIIVPPSGGGVPASGGGAPSSGGDGGDDGHHGHHGDD